LEEVEALALNRRLAVEDFNLDAGGEVGRGRRVVPGDHRGGDFALARRGRGLRARRVRAAAGEQAEREEGAGRKRAPVCAHDVPSDDCFGWPPRVYSPAGGFGCGGCRPPPPEAAGAFVVVPCGCRDFSNSARSAGRRS
jgi:hypothetical protein